MPRAHHSERIDLIMKSRESMLSAIQIYNNPLVTFKSESFIVLSMIAWTYLLHAYYRGANIEYRYFDQVGARKKFRRNYDRSIQYWELRKCLLSPDCPVEKNVVNNLNFLIGLRNQVEHCKANSLDSYLSARYQACALNFNHYLKRLHGEKYGLDASLAMSLQFADLDYSQSKSLLESDLLIPKEIISYVKDFDASLTDEENRSDAFAYRLLFTKVVANRKGQADRVVEFIDPNSELAKGIAKEYWVVKEREKVKFTATLVVKRVREAGFPNFGIHAHTIIWQENDAKNPDKGFGTMVVKTWYWYENWIDFVISELRKGTT